MFEKNPVKTEEGIFRRDVSGHWWELEIKPLDHGPFTKADETASHISDAMKNLEGAVIIEKDDEPNMIVKGWKKVSASYRVAEIEKSINSGRIVLELDFI